MLQAELIPQRDIVAFVRERGLHGRGAGWIDIHLLASAKVERLLFSLTVAARYRGDSLLGCRHTNAFEQSWC